MGPVERLEQQQLAQATIAIEAELRHALTKATFDTVTDPRQREQLAGGVCALMLRRYVQAAENSREYLETVMRMILTP